MGEGRGVTLEKRGSSASEPNVNTRELGLMDERLELGVPQSRSSSRNRSMLAGRKVLRSSSRSLSRDRSMLAGKEALSSRGGSRNRSRNWSRNRSRSILTTKALVGCLGRTFSISETGGRRSGSRNRSSRSGRLLFSQTDSSFPESEGNFSSP